MHMKRKMAISLLTAPRPGLDLFDSFLLRLWAEREAAASESLPLLPLFFESFILSVAKGAAAPGRLCNFLWANGDLLHPPDLTDKPPAAFSSLVKSRNLALNLFSKSLNFGPLNAGFGFAVPRMRS